MRISDMRQKEVINLSDGKRLGFVCDVGFDLEEGQIQSLIVPGESRISLFGKNQDIVIPWESIKKIGNDIVLVDFE
ncbi:MAG: YlmC/YmxH family sporulation protein [Clostridia bacterium]|nr:YlmC/YmxH family sporulation protein [Clostridia bacterium]